MGSGSSAARKKKEEVVEQVDAAKVRKIIATSKSGSFKNQVSAANSLMKIVQNGSEALEHVAEGNGLASLIELFSSKSAEVQEKCLNALSEFCKSEKFRRPVFEHGGCATMITGVQSPNSNVRDAAVEAAWNISELEEAQVKLVEDGIVPWLVLYVKDDTDSYSKQMQLRVLQMLCRMAATKQNVSRLVDDGTLEGTFHAIHSAITPLENKVLATKVMSQLCNIKPSHQRIYHLNGGTGLLRVVALLSTHDEDIRTHAAAAIADLCQSTTLAHEMVTGGVLQPLRRLLRSKNLPAAAAALRALTVLANKDPEYQVAIGQGALVPPMVKLCRDAPPETELAVARLLVVIAQADTNLPHIVNGGGHKVLRQCAQGGRPDAAGAAVPDAELVAAAEAVLSRAVFLIEARRDAMVSKAVRRFKGLEGEDPAPAEPGPPPKLPQ